MITIETSVRNERISVPEVNDTDYVALSCEVDQLSTSGKALKVVRLSAAGHPTYKWIPVSLIGAIVTNSGCMVHIAVPRWFYRKESLHQYGF